MRFRLCESIEYDSEGNPLSEEQIKFFKDSKVRSNSGNLLVCYHGSKSSFSSFEYGHSSYNMLGKGFYFTPDKRRALGYGKHLVSAYLNLKNPFMSNNTSHIDRLLNLLGKTRDSIEIWAQTCGYEGSIFFKICNYTDDNQIDIQDSIISLGFDGIMHYAYGELVEMVAFDSNQIKSITNKSPTNSSNINETLLYRTESAFGSGIRDLRDVIQFEIEELQNTDIPDTLLDNFKMTKEQENILRTSYETDNIDYDRLVDTCLDIVHRKYPNAKYALWLADKDAVKDYYGGKDEDIDAYEIENDEPISDLGYEGKLFVYSKYPEPKTK